MRGKQTSQAPEKRRDSLTYCMDCKGRDKMRESYTELRSIVPNLPPRASKMKVLEGTIAYTRVLEEEMVALEAQKKARVVSPAKKMMIGSTSSPSVEVAVASKEKNMALFGLCSPQRRLGLLTQVLQVFDNNGADVLATTVAGDGGGVSITITAAVIEGGEAVEDIKRGLIMIL